MLRGHGVLLKWCIDQMLLEFLHNFMDLILSAEALLDFP